MRLSDEGYAINQLADRGRPLPDWYLNQPELLPGQRFYIEAFDRLSTCRAVADGVVGRIPWTAIQKYAEVHEMTSYEEFRIFEVVIEKLDIEYVRWVKDKAKETTDG